MLDPHYLLHFIADALMGKETETLALSLGKRDLVSTGNLGILKKSHKIAHHSSVIEESTKIH